MILILNCEQLINALFILKKNMFVCLNNISLSSVFFNHLSYRNSFHHLIKFSNFLNIFSSLNMLFHSEICHIKKVNKFQRKKLTQYVFGAELTEVFELEVDVNDGSTSRNC